MAAGFLYLTAHWAVSSQYLKTSFVLPRILSMASLEYKSSDAMRDADNLRAMNRQSLILLKEIDETLIQEKIALGKIKLKMLIFNTAMTLLLLAITIFDYKKFQWMSDHNVAQDIDQSLTTLLLLLNTLILTYSVIKIRRRINLLPNTFPNENLIAIHVINSFVYTILQFVVFIVLIIQNYRLDEKAQYEVLPKELQLKLV